MEKAEADREAVTQDEFRSAESWMGTIAVECSPPSLPGSLPVDAHAERGELHTLEPNHEH